MITLDEVKLKELIKEAVLEALEEKAKRQYTYYVTVGEFCEISGLGESWFRNHILYHPDFRECLYRPDRKYYINVDKGLYKLEKIMDKYRI